MVSFRRSRACQQKGEAPAASPTFRQREEASAEAVANDIESHILECYPHPLAHAFGEAQRQIKLHGSTSDLSLALCGACEVSASYLSSILLAQYVELGLMHKEVEEELGGLAGKKGLSFGDWIRLPLGGARGMDGGSCLPGAVSSDARR